MSSRDFKDTLYAHFARIGHALSSPKRIELLDLLTQGEKTVEMLALQSATPVKNTSAHLRDLRHARLVETRREGTYIFYRLADEDDADFLRSFQDLGRRRLAEVEQVARLYLDDRDALKPVTFAELRKLMRDDQVTIIDVRPRTEFEAGHIPGALSIPVEELKHRVGELPKRKEVIAYCRGPYCVYSLDAVNLLRREGYRARRVGRGFPQWRSGGFAVALGSDPHSGQRAALGRRPPRRR